MDKEPGTVYFLISSIIFKEADSWTCFTAAVSSFPDSHIVFCSKLQQTLHAKGVFISRTFCLTWVTGSFSACDISCATEWSNLSCILPALTSFLAAATKAVFCIGHFPISLGFPSVHYHNEWGQADESAATPWGTQQGYRCGLSLWSPCALHHPASSKALTLKHQFTLFRHDM